MNRVKSQQKVLVSMLSVLVALVIACGTIGTRDATIINAATEENDPATEGNVLPEVQTQVLTTEEYRPAVNNEVNDVRELLPDDVDGDDETVTVENEAEEALTTEGDMGEENDVTTAAEEETTADETVRKIKAVFELSEEERPDVPEDVPEKVAKLLVTSKEYYDEAVVGGAQSIPLESNDARYNYITGSPFKVYTMTDKPEWYPTEGTAFKRMSTFEVPYWVIDKNGTRKASSGKITVNALLADSVKCIFSDIFMLGEQFPINYLVGFMYRKVGGAGLVKSPILSAHSFGVAIDINNGDYDNDLYVGKGNDLRDKNNPFCISDDVIDVFKAYGWNWGGEFDICSDTMHFQYFGLEFLQYDSDEPFPVLIAGQKADAKVVENLRSRLKKLGYLKKASGRKYDDNLAETVKKFQEDNGLEPDGIVDYETWVPIINQTHDMPYVF
ncbi:MAG: M15 family metallopeptidase [Lachnospiraceae bacterium]|nr:M15 family metallopeptidase [Lachnospiraceae bacterium]